MDALEMLYDHYKETFCLSKEAQARRNKSFIVLCILEAFTSLDKGIQPIVKCDE